MAHQVNPSLLLRQVARIGICAAIGYFSWNGHVNALALLPLIIFIWRDSNHRRDAFVALLAYYLAAGRGLLTGANVFFNEPFGEPGIWYGIAIWVAPSVVLASTWAIGWSTSHKSLRLIAIFCVLSLPPIGIIGWANPLTSACALFPGLGWIGFGLTLILFAVIAQTKRYALLLPFAAIAITANATQAPYPTPTSWVNIDTHYNVPLDSAEELQRMRELQKTILWASKLSPHKTIFLLPEAVGGDWSVNKIWWQRTEHALKQKNQTAIIGARYPHKQKYINMLVSVGEARDLAFVNRVPIPLGMWNPLQKNSAQAAWWGNGIQKIGGQKIAALICYEQLLIWPVLASISQNPDMLIGASNHWWAKETSIPRIQRQTVMAWGRLFNIPITYSENL